MKKKFEPGELVTVTGWAAAVGLWKDEHANTQLGPRMAHGDVMIVISHMWERKLVRVLTRVGVGCIHASVIEELK